MPIDETTAARRAGLVQVLVFWLGYIVVLVLAAFATGLVGVTGASYDMTYGALGSLGAIALVLLAVRRLGGESGLRVSSGSVTRFALGAGIGAAAFAAHTFVVLSALEGVHVEAVEGVGAANVLAAVAGFVALSCQEELGFRGFAFRRLDAGLGLWPAVATTSVAFAGAHVLYGWDLRLVAFGVLPGGVLFGMSAAASGGLALPIGLHAAWNVGDWFLGQKATPGPWRLRVDGHTDHQVLLVGSTSYLATFALLTLAFWLVHRRRYA